MELIHCGKGVITLAGRVKHNAPLLIWLEKQLGGFVEEFYNENSFYTLCNRGMFSYDMVNHVLKITYTPKRNKQ